MDNSLRLCGFNAQTVQYLIDQGFATPSSLLLASESDLESIARAVARNPPRQQVNISFIALKNLMGLRFWADERRRTGYEADPDDFDEDDVPVFTAKCQEYNEQKQAAKDEDASKPEGLKKLANWALWNEGFQNYLRQILSAAKIPLVYLSRDERGDPDEVLDPENFETPTEYLIEATIFSGRHYEIDNARFYRELKSFTVNGEAWSYIKKFERSQDGRKAYLALKTQCEGTASKITRKNKAYASIANATYSGSRRQYKFQDYINTHQAAHNEILDCDPTEAVPESKKVADFLKGITDPKLESPVSVVLGDLKMLNDFQKCQQYLSTTVENRATLEKSKERNISGVKSSSGDKSEKKDKGKLPKGFKLENKWYPPRIFRLLSQEQKDQLREWNEKKGKRSVAAIKKQIKDELKNERKKRKEKDTDTEEDSSADDAAGKEFGRGAHKKKQKKDSALNASTVAMLSRTVYSVNYDTIHAGDHRSGRCEMDSHADTCVAGMNCVVLEYTGLHADVQAYSPDYPSKRIPIATVATAYDCPTSAATFILIINEALYFGESLPFTLLSPNQLRDNDVHVDERHRRYAPDSIFGVSIPSESLTIPFALDGVIAGFDTRPPSQDELDDTSIHVELTSDVEWIPSSFAPSPAEEQGTSSDDEQRISSLRGRRSRVLASKSAKRRIKSCHQTLIATQSLFEIETANEVNMLNQDDPILKRIAALTTGRADPRVNRNVYAIRTGDATSDITPENVAKRWMVGVETAKSTLNVTTQKGVRSIPNPATRRFKTQMAHLRYPRLGGMFYADIMEPKVKSLESQRYAHIIRNGRGFTKAYPMERKNESIYALDDFVKKVGIPETLLCDNDATMEGWSEWKKRIRKYSINPKYTEPYSPFQNKAELDTIRELKRMVRRFQDKSKSPRRLWNYLVNLCSKIRSFVAGAHPDLHGRSAFEQVHGWTPDISMYVMHGWYEVVAFLDNDNERKLACWLGPAEDYGGGDAVFLLPKSAKPIVRSTVWTLTPDERADKREEIDELLKLIDDKIGNDRTNEEVLTEVGNDLLPHIDLFGDTDDANGDDPIQLRANADEYTPEAFDKYLSAQIVTDRGGEMLRGTVKSRKRDSDGNPTGSSNPNPILDTREYLVCFEDGTEDTYTANLIAECIYSQIDDNGRRLLLMKEIIDHKKTQNAISEEDAYYSTKSGPKPKRTTRGWRLLVEWKDGSSTWAPLADLKDAYPIQIADYAVANNLTQEPAFRWWVPFVLKKRERILKKVKTKYWSTTHKYGLELPKNVAQALAIDKRTGTDFWHKAIEKEIRNVFPAFEFLADDDAQVPPGYQFVETYFVFDIKMDLTRKARLVARGSMTEATKDETFASVVSRDTVRIFFLLAALNDVELLSCDIQNAYLAAPNKEKVWTKFTDQLGPEYNGRSAIIAKALYGLRSSGRSFRDYLAMNLRKLGFISSKADPDLWMRSAKKSNGDKIYEYVISYVDDLIFQGVNPKEFMEVLGKRFTLKAGSIKEPDTYLGANVKKFRIPNSDDPDKVRWAFESTSYVKKAINDLERELDEANLKLLPNAKTPLGSGYRPELDLSPELGDKQLNYYQGLIGILRWICELGRIDILMPVSMMSRYLVSARQGHLEQLFHIFAYLKHHPRSTMVFDDTCPTFKSERFVKCDWSEFYPDASEAIPINIPESRGKEVVMSCFVDADHAGCRETRRSHTAIIIFINRAPILWFSKRQNTVEASTYGSELLAMRISIEMIEGLRYKLRMMGVPLLEECSVFCDNSAVVTNTKLESTLKKKHAAINFHRVREAIAAGTIRVAKEGTQTNLADILTKPMPGSKMKELLEHILW